MKSDSQANLAYTEIRRQILIMQLHPDSRLKEDVWAKRLQVSRMAVREALTRLLGEGLVNMGEKGGYFVYKMLPEDTHQIWEIREVLEVAAVRMAVQRITKEQLVQLRKICDDFSDLTSKNYIAGACEADIKFHEKLVESSGNARLVRAYHYSNIPLFQQILGKTKEYFEDNEQTDKEHRQILEALQNRDANKAEKVLKEHFKRGALTILTFE